MQGGGDLAAVWGLCPSLPLQEDMVNLWVNPRATCDSQTLGSKSCPALWASVQGLGGLDKGPGHTQASPSRWHYSIWHSHSSGSWFGQCRHICVWRVSGRKPMRKNIAVCILRSSGHDSASTDTRQSSVLLSVLGKSARAHSTHRQSCHPVKPVSLLEEYRPGFAPRRAYVPFRPFSCPGRHC